MASCCACCCFYPKYKRKVDNIYPRNIDAPLIKNEVDKLQYYVTVHPEKLSKIGDYLYQNLKWGVSGTIKYRNYVKNTIEAVEKILIVITPQNLNFYAESYFKIVQKLLEQGGSNSGATAPKNSASNQGITSANSNGTLNSTNNDSLEYQKLATNLFQKFCEKEASNLSAVKELNQFVCQFSSMCYNNNKDERIRAEIRSSGLQCLATMVKRFLPDDTFLVSCIWDNMDKIIPALLYIIHENYLVNLKNGEVMSDDYEDDGHDEQELGPFLYGDFYSNNKLKRNSGEATTGSNDTNLENIKIQFRKTSHNSENSNRSCPDEGKVMINMNNNGARQVIEPDHEAKMLLKNISTKADYTTIGKIVVPILAFLDDNRPTGWALGKFVRCIFLIVMYNVKQQHAIVIKELIKHLDSHRNSSAKLKCYIIRSIIVCIRIAAMQSVGTAGQIIEIFTNLLKHLDYSVEKSFNLKAGLLNKHDGVKVTVDIGEEAKLQTEIIGAMGQFTSNLPDYAKNDVFMFIARQINSQQFSYIGLTPGQKVNNEQLNSQLRTKYFECLHEICTKYKPVQLFSAFTSGQFLEDILRLTLVSDWASRKKAHEILHQLLDKYQLMDKIKIIKPGLFNETSTGSVVTVLKNRSSNLSLNNLGNQTTRNQTYLSQLELNESGKLSTSKEDVQFMRKHGRVFLSHLNENLFLVNNRRENYETIYLTLCLFLIGLFNEKEFLVDLVRFGFHVQDLALLNHEQKQFSFSLQCNIHKFVCAYFLLLSKSSGVAELYTYCSDICDLRRRRDLFKFVYPEYILLDNQSSDSGVQSTSTSLTEIETEFKRDLTSSCKEYSKFVQELTSSKENLNKSNMSLNLTNSRIKMTPWLFDKHIIDDILKKAGFSTSNLFTIDSEFSLSVSYLQQSINSLQTVLKFRSPYSNSYESIANFNNNNQSELGTEPSSATATHPTRHNRGYSGFGVSPSVNQFNQTPRRSVDVESTFDEDTNYDSASQASMDQNGYDLDPINQNFYIDQQNVDNQATVNSINALRQQYYQDATSFETLKRALFNGGSNLAGSNLSTSGVGAGGASTVGPASSLAALNNNNNNSPYLTNQQNSEMQEDIEERNTKIISDFKQKTFGELQQSLMKTNQFLIDSEKYQQVFDLITKENSSVVTENILSVPNGNREQNLSASSLATTASNQSSSLIAIGALGNIQSFKENASNNNNNPSRQVALNDIEFPQLFMY